MYAEVLTHTIALKKAIKEFAAAASSSKATKESLQVEFRPVVEHFLNVTASLGGAAAIQYADVTEGGEGFV